MTMPCPSHTLDLGAGNGVARSAVDKQALQGAEQPLGAARQARQFDEPVREWKPGLPARELLA